MSSTVLAQQQALLRALWQPSHASAIADIAAHAHPPLLERGLRAYRANAQALAERALSAAYPVLAQLLDQDNFTALAREFWHAHPPERGDLAQWGEALAGFIEELAQLAGEPYLADVARVEWALHCAATAADSSLDSASFHLLASHDPATLTLVLSSGWQTVASNYPVASIVLAHINGEPSLAQASQRLRDGAQEIAVIWRQGLRARLREAWPGEAALLQAIGQRASLLEASSVAPDLDFQSWLANAVPTGLVICATTLKDLTS